MTVSIEIEIESESSEDCCPKCGCEYEDGDKFCADCGMKLPAPKAARGIARMSSMNKMLAESAGKDAD